MRRLAEGKTKRRIHFSSIAASLLGFLFSACIEVGSESYFAETMGWASIAQYTFLTLCMLLAWWTAPAAKTLTDVRLLLLVAVVSRCILIPVDPYLSNDMDRYLFDGKIALEGYDPYRISHDAPELLRMKIEWSPPLEHEQYATLYPPLSLSLFALAATAGAEYAPVVWKLIVALFSVLVVFVSALLMRNLGRLQHLALVSMSPLLILEAGVGAHVDAVSTFFVVSALYVYASRRLVLTGIFVGLGTLTKILPVMLMIPLVFGQKAIADRLRLSGALMLTVCLGYGVLLANGLVPIGSIGTLFEKWRFGSPVFSLLEWGLEGWQPAGLVALALVAGLIFLAHHAWKLETYIEVTHWNLSLGMALVLMLSPVVFPWYLMVLVPLVAISPRPFLLTWVCTIPVTYEVLNGFYSRGDWSPALWPLAVIFTGFIFSILMEFRMRSFDRRQIIRDQDAP